MRIFFNNALDCLFQRYRVAYLVFCECDNVVHRIGLHSFGYGGILCFKQRRFLFGCGLSFRCKLDFFGCLFLFGFLGLLPVVERLKLIGGREALTFL